MVLGSSRQSREKSSSLAVTSFKGWTMVPLEKGKKWNLGLHGTPTVAPMQSG